MRRVFQLGAVDLLLTMTALPDNCTVFLSSKIVQTIFKKQLLSDGIGVNHVLDSAARMIQWTGLGECKKRSFSTLLKSIDPINGSTPKLA